MKWIGIPVGSFYYWVIVIIVFLFPSSIYKYVWFAKV